MRIFVLGASGFVGRHLVRECLSRGDEVSGTHAPVEVPPREPAIEWSALDLLDARSVAVTLSRARPEAIVHLAGQANVARAHREPLETFRANAEGTLALLSALRDAGSKARVIAVTSAEVYGAVPPAELPVREERPVDPRTPYGLSKAAADLAAALAARDWGLDVVRMRPFNHVGPGQRPGFVVPDFASQIAAAERGEAPHVLSVGNLSPRRDFTDVRDIVRAYRVAIERGRSGEAYNLCSGRSASMEEIARWFVAHARVPVEIRCEAARRRTLDLDEIRGDPSKAERELGWKAEIPLERSLAEVLDEWRASPSDRPS